MRASSKKSLFLSSLGVLIISALAGIFLSATAGILVACATTIACLYWSILSHLYDIQTLIHDNRTELQKDLDRLAIEVSRIQGEFAEQAGLSIVTQYLQLRDHDCPLFTKEAEEIYQETVDKFAMLQRHELRTDNHEQVYHWLEFLFRDFDSLKRIRAISSGEFNEWRAVDSWWIRHYLRLHQIAHARGVQIERIFILKAKNQVRTYEDVFRRNIDYNVDVKIALRDRIGPADFKVGNCMLFYTERKEPIYALVAHHNHHGDLEGVVIYRDTQAIKHIAEAYERIASIAKPCSLMPDDDLDQSNTELAPRKSA